MLPETWGKPGRNPGQRRKTNVGQVGNLRGGWLPPSVHREGGRGRLPIGRRLPTCPTKSRPPTDARSVFHQLSRAEGPSQQYPQIPKSRGGRAGAQAFRGQVRHAAVRHRTWYRVAAIATTTKNAIVGHGADLR